MLFWHMNYLHWRENQTSTQGFPQVLRTRDRGGGGGGLFKMWLEALSQYMGEGAWGASKKRENILLTSVL